jgi:hypothetical protein
MAREPPSAAKGRGNAEFQSVNIGFVLGIFVAGHKGFDFG